MIRLRPPVLAVAAVALAVALLDVSLSVACGYEPQWLPAQISWPAFVRFQAHVAAVEMLQRTGLLDDHHLVVVLGSSTAKQDFDCQVLHANDPLHRQWLVLGAGALNFAQVEGYARALTDSDVRPSLVVIGMEPSLTSREDVQASWIPQASLKSFPHDLRTHRFRDAGRDCIWLDRNRDLLENAMSVLLDGASAEVRAVFHLPLAVSQPPTPDPWDVSDLPTLHGDAADVEGKWSWRMELLRPAHYESAERSISAFARLVAELRRRGATVVGLLTPATSRLRAAYPPIVIRRLHEAIAAASAIHPLHILDLQDSMPDDQFYDDAHLNTPGKRRFSAELPAHLR